MRSNKYSVRLLSVAEQDLQALLSYLAAENPLAAATALGRIENGLHALERHPLLGRTPNDRTVAGLGYRVLVIGNYLAFYKVKGKTVLIHRVLHGARDFVRLLMD